MLDGGEITKRYGPTVAVDGLSFEVLQGEVTGFLGSNGDGKSTTMRMMVGLDEPTPGQVRIVGQRYHDLCHPLHHVVDLLGAKAIHPGRNARNDLRWWGDSKGIVRLRVDHVPELANRFPPDAGLDVAWRAGIEALQPPTSAPGSTR